MLFIGKLGFEVKLRKNKTCSTGSFCVIGI